jgi:hypothetical protein
MFVENNKGVYMSNTVVKLSNSEHCQIVSDFAEKMDLPLTKAVVLAVMLANKYQQTELENRALRQALASTQSTNEDFYAFVSSEIGKK